MIDFLKEFSESADKVSFFLGKWMGIEREYCDSDKKYRYGQFYNKFYQVILSQSAGL